MCVCESERVREREGEREGERERGIERGGGEVHVTRHRCTYMYM